MSATQTVSSDHPGALRTTLLELVQSLTRPDRSPDDVVQIVHESIENGNVILTGNFKNGLGQDRDDSAPSEAKRESSQVDIDARWKALMTASQQGDAEAYQQLLRDLLPEVTRLVRARLFDPSTVDDVVQNAMLKLHRARHTYRPERAFGPWLRAIVRNTTIDHLRQIKRRQDREASVESIELIEDPNGNAEVEDNELSCELAGMLAELPPRQREAVELIQITGLSISEASRRVGISPGALKLRAHRGYRALRERMKEQGATGRSSYLSA